MPSVKTDRRMVAMGVLQIFCVKEFFCFSKNWNRSCFVHGSINGFIVMNIRVGTILPQSKEKPRGSHRLPIWGTTMYLRVRRHRSPSRGLHDRMTQWDHHCSSRACFSSVCRNLVPRGILVRFPVHWTSSGQIARLVPRAFLSFVFWSASWRTLDSVSCHWWATA